MKNMYYALYEEEDDIPNKIDYFLKFLKSFKEVNPHKDNLENVHPEFVVITVESYSTTAQLKKLLKRPDISLLKWEDCVKYFIEKNIEISKYIKSIFGKK